jgi:hypothetical protein
MSLGCTWSQYVFVCIWVLCFYESLQKHMVSVCFASFCVPLGVGAVGETLGYMLERSYCCLLPCSPHQRPPVFPPEACA